jgi:hypothetical protein
MGVHLGNALPGGIGANATVAVTAPDGIHVIHGHLKNSSSKDAFTLRGSPERVVKDKILLITYKPIHPI